MLEPLADDHSSDGEDTPTGVEESAAPAVAAAPERAAMSLLERLQAIRITHGTTHNPEQQHRSPDELLGLFCGLNLKMLIMAPSQLGTVHYQFHVERAAS